MLILFVLLRCKFCRQSGLTPLLRADSRYMALLFVPIGVGVMQYLTYCARNSARGGLLRYQNAGRFCGRKLSSTSDTR